MSSVKKVQFIEKIEKTKLGLDGLQIVVIADKCSTRDIKNETISFNNIAKQCLNEVNGQIIKEKYPELEGQKFKEKLHEKRVEWMKQKLP